MCVVIHLELDDDSVSSFVEALVSHMDYYRNKLKEIKEVDADFRSLLERCEQAEKQIKELTEKGK